MDWLALQEGSMFVGQAVAVPGTAMSNTLVDVGVDKLLEMPVAEEMQMGLSIGLALDGYIPITVYPRWNFLLLAMNQLVNHLDKMKHISNNGYKPKLIIRTSIGSERPLHPQYQHVGDFTEAFKMIFEDIDIIKLEEAKDIFQSYEYAFTRTDERSTLIVEFGDYYNEK